ncbi:hypothetical protein BYT27DRAFT_7197291 [Phlegmacium glaucopus]|nr:hypothetical protein BYT27DRAFT_7197291 [Phlegmacium glaucopus]
MLPSTTDDSLFDHLPPIDLLRYSRASKTTYEAVSSYMRRSFNLNKLMGRFFTENEMSCFRSWQSRTGMLISGSTALQFFDRTFYPESDLDIYVEHRYCKAIAFWLIDIGYTYKPRPRYSDQDLAEALRITTEYLNCGVANVYDFHKSNPDRKIQLITSHHSPLEPILNFHSTCVMNLISHEKAYSLYPQGTFRDRRSLIVYGEGSSRQTEEFARGKYAARGWKLVEELTKDGIVHPTSEFSTRSRYVGDSKCWTIPILPRLQLPEGYIETNSWYLLYDEAGCANMEFRNLIAPTLRYSYLVKDIPLQRYILPALSSFKSEEKWIFR